MGIKITLQGDFKNLLNLEYNGKKIKTLENLNKAIKNKEWKARNIWINLWFMHIGFNK